jgi:uridine kinase
MASAEPAPSAGEVESVADRLLSLPPTLGRVRMLAIDGPAGSGKSTLAAAVSDRLAAGDRQVRTVSLDDLYEGWTGLDEGLEDRVLSQLLQPLAAGRAARWQAYDWAGDTFGDWHDLPVPDVLVLEGCGAGARRFARYLTLLVWIEAQEHTRTARMVARDGAEVLQHLPAWTALERRTFRVNDTRTRADVRLTT